MTSPSPTADPEPGSDGGLVCDGVAVARGGTVVVHDVDLGVPSGRLTVLVGPSGAGKTTLVRAVAGLEPLAAGRVRLAGRDLTGLPVHRRRTAMVFQQPRLFPSMDVADNVAFALRMQGMARADRRHRAARLLDEVGLAGFGDRAVRGLSGGEQQRVGLARALSTDPDLLMLDEPLASVDPNRREAVRRLVRRVQRDRGLTCLYVTHDRGEAAELGDSIAVVLDGTIVQHGTPHELFERPRSPVVAAFLGNPNRLVGTVTDGRLPVGDGAVAVPGPDGPVQATIRPEHVALTAPASPGAVTARVVEATYQGTGWRVALALDDHTLEAWVTTAPPAEGDRVGVVLPAAFLWWWPQAPGSRPADATPQEVG